MASPPVQREQVGLRSLKELTLRVGMHVAQARFQQRPGEIIQQLAKANLLIEEILRRWPSQAEHPSRRHPPQTEGQSVIDQVLVEARAPEIVGSGANPPGGSP